MDDPALDTVIRAERAVIGGEIRSAAIGILRGLIRLVGRVDGQYRAASEVVLPSTAVLMPGLVDSHVHIDEPGTDWEGFATATAAAAAAGITTLVDMPLDSDPVTTSAAALAAKRAAAQGNCQVTVGYWGGVVPDNIDNLEELALAGVLGFKCFLADSGNPNFPPLRPAEFYRAMSRIAALGSVLLVHAESDHTLAQSPAARGCSYSSFLRSRPDAAEVDAVSLVLDAARATGARAHIVHVSSAQVLPLIAAAKRAGVAVTAETCPHYLTFAADDIPAGATEFAVCPPIRRGDNRQQLWTALSDGVLDMVVSDHSPCAPEAKGDGDFGRVFGGISSLQLGPRVVWTRARMRGFTLVDVCRWMAEAPAALAGLTDRGRIAVGTRADFCVFDPDAESVAHADALHHRHAITPYDGTTLRGAVLATWLGGRRVRAGTSESAELWPLSSLLGLDS
ncbi:allantoinase AllB [Mycolicibacterium komossense]|uniref:allantoinase AllB n=1 Tax=Mycolicibacterium komossense TaxID=1779 RepID=UPI0021F2C0E3|nr:allantoinase AllB [Mycolicibacterium komossense]